MCFRPAKPKMNKCHKCGKINKPIAKECVECGAEIALGKEPCPQCEALKDAMEVCPSCGFVPEVECPKCHTMNPVTGTECANCGFKAPTGPPAPRGASGRPPTPPKAPPAPPKAPPKKPGL